MELDELYQEIILDHSKRPRNYGTLENATVRARGENPSCGDEIEVHIKLTPEGQIEDIRFSGQGCAISQASASMMTLSAKGKSREEALQAYDFFQNMLVGEVPNPLPKMLGDARLLKGVRQFPQRVKCATLGWQALRQALNS